MFIAEATLFSLKKISFITVLVFSYLMIAFCAYADETSLTSGNDAAKVSESISKAGDKSIWLTEAGHGFRAGTQNLGLGAGATYGVLMFGGTERHHLAFGTLSYGYMLSGLKMADHWYGGNWEIQIELFGGGQFNSNSAYIAGLTPHLRYNFATGSRWIPFIDVGFGATLTDISVPDLGGTFQFNTQLGIGVQWFVKDDVAVTCKALYMHISSAGTSYPNDGVNTIGGVLGAAWYF